MPENETIERAREDEREGKSPTTQAGEFVREEIHHLREGKHGARSTKQAIAIGLQKARRAGVDLPPPKKGKVSEKTRKSAERAYERGQGTPLARKPSARRSRAVHRALEREGTVAGSTEALSKQAKSVARRRTPGERSQAARKAAETKGPAERRQAAKKAARTRSRPERAPARRGAADHSLPIDNYEQMTVPEVRRELRSLDTRELRKVQHYEEKHKHRKGVLEAVERRLHAA